MEHHTRGRLVMLTVGGTLCGTRAPETSFLVGAAQTIAVIAAVANLYGVDASIVGVSKINASQVVQTIGKAVLDAIVALSVVTRRTTCRYRAMKGVSAVLVHTRAVLIAPNAIHKVGTVKTISKGVANWARRKQADLKHPAGRTDTTLRVICIANQTLLSG